MDSLKAGVLLLIYTCLPVLLIKRMTYLCKESLLNVSQIELLPSLKTFFFFFLQISFWSFQITLADQLHFIFFSILCIPSTFKLDFWKDFKVRQTGDIGQDRWAKAQINSVKAEWDIPIDRQKSKRWWVNTLTSQFTSLKSQVFHLFVLTQRAITQPEGPSSSLPNLTCGYL